MSSRQLFTCQHCGRSNFKSQLGLQQHQERSISCNQATREGKRKLAHNYEQTHRNNHARQQDDTGPNAESAEESGQDADNTSALNQDLSDQEPMSEGEIIMDQDDDSWGIGSVTSTMQPDIDDGYGERTRVPTGANRKE